MEELTQQQRDLLIECVECTCPQQTRRLLDKIDRLLPNRTWGYIWDPVGRIRVEQSVLDALGPPYSSLKGVPSEQFAFGRLPEEAPKPAATLPTTRPQSPATAPQRRSRPKDLHEYSEAERQACYARARAEASPAAPEEPAPSSPGMVWCEERWHDGKCEPARWVPVEAFRA